MNDSDRTKEIDEALADLERQGVIRIRSENGELIVRLVQSRTVFQTWESKNSLYNRLFETINQEADPIRRDQLGKAFDEVRAAVRHWDRLFPHDEDWTC